MKPAENHIVCGIEAEKLAVAYGTHVALNLESLGLQGNIIAVIGHNGAGKSTLIKAMLRLLPPLSGRLESWCEEGGRRRWLRPENDMAFCPGNGAVFADIPVESYVRLWCRIKTGRADYYLKDGARYLEMMDMGPLMSKLGRELSKGQRRRVQTLIGILTRPKFFLVDEPFCGLDVQKTNELANIIFEMSREMSFLLASHRMDVIERLADSVLVLKHGRLVTCGSVSAVAKTLCRQTVRITHLSDPDRMYGALREHFPLSLVNRHAGEIDICGTEFEAAELGALVQSVDANGARLEPSAPTLVDALNYHLKQVSCSLSD